MFPYISDLLNYLFGTHLAIPVFTFGVFIVLGVVAAFLIVYLEMKRLEKAGHIPQNSHRLIFTILNISLISAFIGAKLFHILDHWGDFLHDPVKILLSPNGHSFYGGLILAGVAVSLLVWYKKIPMPYAFDIAAPAIFIGSGIGRLACYFSGDGCWGIVNTSPKPGWLAFLPDWLWGATFPHNIINQGVQIEGCIGVYCHALPLQVFPTSLYESLIALAWFVLLWSLRKKNKVPGTLFSLFLLLNGITRFLVEFIRVNPRISLLGLKLSQAQFIALLFIVASGLCFLYFRRIYEKKFSARNIL